MSPARHPPDRAALLEWVTVHYACFVDSQLREHNVIWILVDRHRPGEADMIPVVLLDRREDEMIAVSGAGEFFYVPIRAVVPVPG